MKVELNLRIPNIREPIRDEATGYPINNADVRFIKVIEVEALPKVGEQIALSIRPDYQFSATVLRAEWSDSKSMFEVACRFVNRSIERPMYLAIIADEEWAMRPLL